MGHAMLLGWLKTGALDAAHLHVVEPVDALRLRAGEAGARTYASADALPETLAPDIVLFAVKPQAMDGVVADYKHFGEPACDTVFVSVAAGVTLAALENALAPGAPVIRVMPNTPAAIGEGMMVMCANRSVTGNQLATARALIETSGVVAVIEDESLMDAVTAVSGSGPAYVFHMIEALRAAGVGAGLPDPLAHQLAMQTIYGAAAYARQSADDPTRLRQQVTSPNGTTAAALEVLMAPDGLSALLERAVRAARDRSIELGR